jgi:hypothetical protein
MTQIDPRALLDLHSTELPKLTSSEKRQHYAERLFRTLEQVGRESRGQPPRVDRLREVARLADQLEAQGVPFGVCSNSIMNRRVREQLNQEAARSDDPRKSRRKSIKAAAVRKWLRDVRWLRFCRDHFTKEPPYTD